MVTADSRCVRRFAISISNLSNVTTGCQLGANGTIGSLRTSNGGCLSLPISVVVKPKVACNVQQFLRIVKYFINSHPQYLSKISKHQRDFKSVTK